MTLVPNEVTTKLGEEETGQPTPHAWWTPRWLRRQRESNELEKWANEVLWQWAATMDGAQLSHASSTAGGIQHTTAPQVHSVDPGPPVTLLVRMLPGQVVEDFQDQAHRIAEGMGVPMVQIKHFDTGWITVFLLFNDSEPTVMPAEEYDQTTQ